MSLFHPIRAQYDGLTRAFGEKRYISLKQASVAMGIGENNVAKSLVKMEQKGLFQDAIPFVDAGNAVVVRDRSDAAFAQTACSMARICRLVNKGATLCGDYRAFVNASRRGNNAARVGKAFMSFAEGMMSGKKASVSLRNSARWLFDEQEQSGEVKETDPMEVFVKLNRYATEMDEYVQSHPDNIYTEELRIWLNNLRRTLETWITGVSSLYTADQAAEAAKISLNRLGTKYLDDFPQMLEVAKKVPAAASSLEEVQRSLLDTMAYLNTVDDLITDMRIRAAVIQIQALLGEINRLYARSDDNYSRSDARSLKNSYLPTLRSLVEKYMSYEQSLKYGKKVTYSPDETGRVLENDVPRALMKIRDDLSKAEAFEMEDEATALRQKLEMDGLI